MSDLEETPRTLEGLREVLFKEIDSIRRGDGSPQRARAIANLARNILEASRIQFMFAVKTGRSITDAERLANISSETIDAEV